METIGISDWQDRREISERCSLLLHHIAGRLFPSSLGEKFVPSQLAFCDWQLARTQPQVSIDEDTLNLYPEHVCLDGTYIKSFLRDKSLQLCGVCILQVHNTYHGIVTPGANTLDQDQVFSHRMLHKDQLGWGNLYHTEIWNLNSEQYCLVNCEKYCKQLFSW